MERRENKLHCLFRCMKRQYAEDMFYNGYLYFNYPIEWIKIAKKGNKGQGDLYEGVYTNVNDGETVHMRDDAEVVPIDGKNYYRSPSVVKNWPCLCFYSISEMTEKKGEEDGAAIYEITKGYIEAFSGKENFDNMSDDLQERSSMLIIPKTGAFLERLRGVFAAKGLEEDKDFWIQPVSYRKGYEAFCKKEIPFELLSKEESFKEQQEYRIILNPNSERMMGLLEGGHRLYIGPMTDIAILKTNFYDGVELRLKGEHITVSYDNWRNRKGSLHEWELLMIIDMLQSHYHTSTCELNGERVGMERLWFELHLILAGKYNIELKNTPIEDGKDDIIVLHPHSDSIDTILVNEEKDCYWYARKTTWLQRMVGSFSDGNPTGVVKVWEENANGELVRQIMVTWGKKDGRGQEFEN